MGLIAANGLARQQKLPVGLAIWIPNVLFALIGIVLLTRMESPRQRDWVGDATVGIVLAASWKRLRGSIPAAPRDPRGAAGAFRWSLRWSIAMCSPVSVLLRACCWSASLLIFHVYTFFELLSDIVKNQIPMSRGVHLSVLPHSQADLRFHAAQCAGFDPDYLWRSHKHNEVTAFKAMRRQSVSSGDSGVAGQYAAQRRSIRLRSLLCAGSESETGRAPQ